MYKQILTIFICLWGMCLTNADAQALIQIPFKQAPVLEVSAETVWIVFPDQRIEIGAEVVISGGSGNYTYSWTYNNQLIGTDPVLFVEEMGNYYLQITDENDCSKSVRFVVSDGTDIAAIEDKEIAVYPNPTYGEVYMESVEGDRVNQITVISAEGKLVKVYNQDFQREGNTVKIDLSGLPKGNYILSYLIGERIITKQVILL